MATITLSRFSKAPPNGPSRLSKILNHLNQQPRLHLKDVTNFKIRWRAQRSPSDIRRFVKDTLPRIRYANPAMPIEADQVWKEKADSNIELTFASGKTRIIKIDDLSSSAILRQLMEAAGGDLWVEFEKKRKVEGLRVPLKVSGPGKKPTIPVTPINPTKSTSLRKAQASPS